MRIRSLVLALVLLSVLVPAAGAIYIPGQEIPDDGLVHIMSAGEGSGVATAPVQMPAVMSMPAFIPALYGDDSGPVIMPTAPDPGGLSGKAEMSQGYKPIFPEAGSIPPYVPGEPESRFVIPAIDLPQPDSEGNIIMDGVIGHTVAPPVPGYWDNLGAMDLHTNMPVLNVPAIFGR